VTAIYYLFETGPVQYIYQWHGQRHRVYPQQVCR